MQSSNQYPEGTPELYRERCLDEAGNQFTVVMSEAPETPGAVIYALEDGTPVVPADPGVFVIPETGKIIRRREEPDAGT